MAGAGLPPPGIYHVPAGVPLLDVLVDRLLDLDVETLGRTRLLLPSRRTCELARRRLLERSGGRPLLLPRIEPVGEVDAGEIAVDPDLAAEVPPAIPPLHRLLALARLVAASGVGLEQAVRLAAELARLLDELATEEVALDVLDRLVPEEFAEHWQRVLAFLAVLRDRWPDFLRACGRIEPAERRRRLLDRRAERWRRDPPRDPVIAAGITGTVPAVARLLAVVARLPRGWVILPGLDVDMDEESWRAVRTTPSHPQWALARLLEEHLGRDRAAVPSFVADGDPTTPARRARARLWREVMRPAGASERWRELPPFPAEAFDGLHLLEAEDRAEEALAVALALREALETPGRSAVLVTTDRHLARRVSAELTRWGLEVDDSAGVPLDQTPPGAFLLHLAHAALEEAPPVALLSALKHPLARGGLPPGVFRARVRWLERTVLRGPRPAGGLPGIRRRLLDLTEDGGESAPDGGVRELLAWFDDVLAALAPLTCLAGARVSLAELLDAHRAVAERLARDEGGRCILWDEAAGRHARRFFHELRAAVLAPGDRSPTDDPGEGDRGPPVGTALPLVLDAGAYPALLAHLMAQQTVRPPPQRRHPRLAILGPIESRLYPADLVVIGALDEGHWPRPAEAGPWFSRAMREEAGLPPVEQKIGFAAHDFVQAASAPRVLLTRARRDEQGQPTVPSRWLQRLEAVLRAAGCDRAGPEPVSHLDWARALDRPAGYRPRGRPRPVPPRAVRPRELRATEIEWLMKDPYRFYARRILGLEPLDPLDADATALERGVRIHEILRAFVAEGPDPVTAPEDARRHLHTLADRHFAAVPASPHLSLLWRARFLALLDDLLEKERERRPDLAAVHTEIAGRLELSLPVKVDPVIRMRADRIEHARGGTYRIVDYKTGALPRREEVRRGLAPQLLLEALALEAGGFRGLDGGPVAAVEYWRLGGKGEVEVLRLDGEVLRQALEDARRGLARLLTHFLGENAPFPAVPRPEVAERANPYAHLARVPEWWGHPEA